MAEADYRFVERHVKFLLWSISGFRVSICGCSEIAHKVFRDIGIYLAYTVVQYNQFYDLKHQMLLGRIMSGKGGDTILAT